MSKRVLIGALVACCGAAVSGAASGQVIQWNNAAGGAWATPANWMPANVPDSTAEDAVIAIPGAYTVTYSSGFQIGGLSIQNPTATLNVANSANLALTRPLVNEGTIRVNPLSQGSTTTLRIDNASTIAGAGDIVLGASSNLSTAIAQAFNVAVVNGADHTIRGTGRVIGNWENDGLIVADVDARILQLDAGSVANRSVLRAEGGGTLNISSPVTQTGTGRIVAEGGAVTFFQSTVTGGTVEILGGGTGTVTSGSVFRGVRVVGPLGIANAMSIVSSDGGIVNDGAITVNTTAGGSTTFLRFDGGAPLNGSGEVVLNASANLSTASVQSNLGTSTNGAAHTIRGTGRIVGSWTNEGVIDADRDGRTLQLDTGDRTNNSIMRATGGGNLQFASSTTTQGTAGRIIADGGTVTLQSATVVGGTVEAVNGGGTVTTGTSGLQGVRVVGPLGIQNSAAVQSNAAGIVNDGTITVNTTAGGSSTLISFTQPGTIGGSGEVVLNASATLATASVQSNAGQSVNGPDHTIRGTGRVSGEWLNQGAIWADVDGRTLQFDGGAKTNAGIIGATDDGRLLVSSSAVTQVSGGRTVADGGTVELASGTVSGGTLEGINGGGTVVTGGSAIPGVVASGPVGIVNSATLSAGSIGFTNNGVITVNTTAAGSVTSLSVAETATIDGNGEIALNASSNPATARLTAQAGTLTVGPGQRVSGRGQLTGSMVLQGRIAPGTATARGVIEALNPLTLTPSAAVEISLGGPAAAANDLVGGSGAKTIAGTLRIDLLGDYAPSGLTVYDVITGSSVSGRFAELQAPMLPGIRRFHVGYTPTAVRVTACAADWDVDGVVGTSDITAFLSDWFADRSGANAAPFRSDYDRDGVVGTSDITAFLSAWFAARAGGC